MSLHKFDWSSLLGPDPRLEPDVVFRVVEDEDTTFGAAAAAENAEKEDVQREKVFQAHKHLLSLVSDVFRRQFFGSLKSENEVLIKGTTVRAFETLLGLIYRGEEAERALGDIKSCSHLFEVLQLADRYQMDGLRRSVGGAIESLDITEENFFEVASFSGEECRRLFFREAGIADSKCRYYVLDAVRDSKSPSCLRKLSQLIRRANSGTGEDSRTLVRLMDEVNRCPNCRKELCADSQPLSLEDARFGMQAWVGGKDGYGVYVAGLAAKSGMVYVWDGKNFLIAKPCNLRFRCIFK